MIEAMSRRWHSVLVALVLLLGGTGAAAAHAVLLSATPADGSVLATAPSEMRLVFNEPISVVATQLLDRSGRSLLGPQDVRAADNEILIRLPANLGDGIYLVSYRIVSLDSHVVGGSVVFTVGAPNAGAPAYVVPTAPVARDGGWRLAFLLDELLFYGASFAALGGTLFRLLLMGRSSAVEGALRRQIEAGALLGVLAVLLGIGLDGALFRAGGFATLFEIESWKLGLHSSFGVSALFLTSGLLLLLLAGQLRGQIAEWLAGLGVAAAVAGFALTGHAATAPPRWLMAPAVGVHVLMAGFWAGSLLPLLLSLRREPLNAASARLLLFSRWGTPAVSLLLASGLALATVQLGSPASLISTKYGLVLLAKLTAVAALLTLAIVNRSRLVPALAAGRADAAAKLRHSIRLELGLFAIIVLLALLLGNFVPPRSASEAAAANREANLGAPSAIMYANGYTATLGVNPARAGFNLIQIRIIGPDGKPFDPQSVALSMANAAAHVEPIQREPQRLAPGLYRLTGSELSLAGLWQFHLLLRISDFDEREFAAAIEIR
jgi:copper transport protein